jgi:hypothetical protein
VFFCRQNAVIHSVLVIDAAPSGVR